MAAQRVIRIPRSDHGFVLIYVTPKSSDTLDLDLLGTENEYPYFATITGNSAPGLKAKTHDLTDRAWVATLSWVFLRQRPPNEHQQLVDRVYVEASIDTKQGIVLTFRQNVEGLTPRVGSISLKRNDELELDMFEWAGILSDDAKSAEEHAAKLQLQWEGEQQKVAKLNAQLEEFIEVKKRQEDEMLERFRQLLNTKKLKIRDQQRLLAGAKVDKSAAENVRKARQANKGGRQSPSRPQKRKANGRIGKRATPEADEDEEMIDDDTNQQETESEDDFEVAQSPQRSASEASEAPAVTTQANASKRGSEGQATSTSSSNTQPVELPPRRELPFAKKSSDSAAPKQATLQGAIDDDDEETDDEL